PAGTAHSGSWYAANGASVTFPYGTFTWGPGVALFGSIVDRGANISAGDVQGSSATLSVTGGTFSVGGPIASSVQNLSISGGTLAGGGEFDVPGSLTWTGGTMSGSGETVLAAGATGTIDPGANSSVYLSGRTLLNQGTLTQNTGQLYGYSGTGAVLDNAGTFNLNAEDASFTGGLGNYDGASLVNTGSVQKTTGTGRTEIDW